MEISKTFLYILYQQNKVLFTLIIGFVLGQLFFSYKGVETLPFFNYGMYSAPCSSRTIYTKTILLEDSEPLALENIPNSSPVFLAYQLNYYSKLVAQDSIDYTQNTIENRFGLGTKISTYLIPKLCTSPEAIHTFPSWLTQYLGTQKLTIKKQQYIFERNKFQGID